MNGVNKNVDPEEKPLILTLLAQTASLLLVCYSCLSLGEGGSFCFVLFLNIGQSRIWL